MDQEILKKFAGEFKPEDMPNGDMKMVAEFCGVEMALLLMSKMAGLNIYIPTFRMPDMVDRYVLANRKKFDVKRLAITCGISETQVYNIFRRADDEANQMDLFKGKPTTNTREGVPMGKPMH